MVRCDTNDLGGHLGGDPIAQRQMIWGIWIRLFHIRFVKLQQN